VKDNGGIDHSGTPPQDWEAEALVGMLELLRPRLERTFHTFRIPPDQAETILEESVTHLLYHSPMPAHPERWMMRTIRRRCARYWREQYREEWLRIELQLHDWLEEEGVAETGRRQRRRLIAALIDRLPKRCRSTIRRRFHLNGDSVPEPLSPFLARESESRCMAAMLRLLEEVRDEGLAS
jgi:DNA-directed RNA polymerase specialized sigma24 family protein